MDHTREQLRAVLRDNVAMRRLLDRALEEQRKNLLTSFFVTTLTFGLFLLWLFTR